MSANRNVNEINMGEQTWTARTNDSETISSVIGTSTKPKYSRSYNKDETYRLLCLEIGKPDLWNQESTNSVESDLDCSLCIRSSLLLFIYVNLNLVRVSIQSAHSSGVGYKEESVLTGNQ